jgi:hypothetical protein
MEFKLISYVKALLPRLDKDQVIEDLRVTVAELDSVVSVSYSAASDFFRSHKFKSSINQNLSADFYRAFDLQGASKQNNFVTEIARRLPYIKDNAVYIQAQVEALFERDILNEGLTAKKALLVRASDHLSFISRFAVDLLNYVYSNESVSVTDEDAEAMKLAPAVQKAVESNFRTFAKLLSGYGIPNEKFSKIVLEVPEVVISSRTSAAVAGMYSEGKLDPLNSAVTSGFYGSPIYTIRLLVAEWQAGRYKANKDKKKVLELRLLHLRLEMEKKPNAKLNDEIVYTQSRVDKIQRYLNEVNADLAVEV